MKVGIHLCKNKNDVISTPPTLCNFTFTYLFIVKPTFLFL